MTTAKKNPGLAARQSTVNAALAASGAAAADAPDTVKGVSMRLPLPMWEQLNTLSHQRQFAKRHERRTKGEADPDSVHGIILTAIEQYLADI